MITINYNEVSSNEGTNTSKKQNYVGPIMCGAFLFHIHYNMAAVYLKITTVVDYCFQCTIVANQN